MHFCTAQEPHAKLLVMAAARWACRCPASQTKIRAITLNLNPQD